jgi:hypothetical protein
MIGRWSRDGRGPLSAPKGSGRKYATEMKKVKWPALNAGIMNGDARSARHDEMTTRRDDETTRRRDDVITKEKSSKCKYFGDFFCTIQKNVVSLHEFCAYA